METFVREVRYAIRSLLHAGGFTAVAIITLAVGIGANTAMFSVVNAVLLRPLPFHDPQQLVDVSESDPRYGASAPSQGSFSYPDFEDVRARSRNLEGVAAFDSSSLTMTEGPQATRVQVETVSASLFGLLGVSPSLGRSFTDNEDQAGPYVAVLSDRFWRSHFNADRDVLGKTVNLNGAAVSIVGVMPPGFQFPVRAKPIDLWFTFAHYLEQLKKYPPAVRRDYHHLGAIARLRPGVTQEKANAEMASIARALAVEYPDTNSSMGIAVRPELEFIVGDTGTPLMILFAAVSLVLLIACANVANLLLARSTGRTREIALRLAIGASRSRIIRQLVTESLVLALVGAAAGIGVAYAALSGVLHLYPSNLPRAEEIGIDLRVLLFTTGIAILTGVLFGLVPALHVSKPDLTDTMREGGRTSTAGPGQNRLRSTLVVAETALGVMLVIVAGLLVRSFQRLSHANLGFNPTNLLTASFNLSETRYTHDQADRFIGELFNRLRVLPGVVSAAATRPLPLFNDVHASTFDLVDRPAPKQNQPTAGFYLVAPGYFETMQIPLINGRTFDQRDRRDSLPVMIITQEFARRYFPEENPIGKRITVEVVEAGRENYRTREIVGVVGDIRRSNLRAAPTPSYYLPLPQLMPSSGPPTLVIRTPIDSGNVFSEVRKVLSGMDPEIALYDARSMEDCLALDLGLARFQTVLLTIFAGIALFLTAVGLYGVVAYTVAQRLHEIGVRQALGATRKDVLWLVMARGIKLVLAGVSIGIVGALGLARFVAALLYEVPSRDPLSYLIACVALASVGLLASYIPALRATRVNPLVALRYE
ncbi:MAG TPA: ABC transporter permease [Candidatus Angelobacter sp.]